MRSFFLLSVVTLCAPLPFAAAAPTLIAFQRGAAIWVANADGSNARKIASGSVPCLSPDGARIAFHTNGGNDRQLKRQIAVADVATKKVTIFTEQIPSQNCQRAVFSPDGSQMAFEILADDDWHLALINTDGSGFRYLKRTAVKGHSLWSHCWAPDGKSLYAQDLDEVRQFALDGQELRHWPIASLVREGSFSSGSQLAISPDGKTLLLDVEMQEEEANLPDWDGPPPAVWRVDFEGGAAKRLTPKGVLGSEPCWLDAATIMYVSQSAKEKTPSVYQLPASGGDPQRVLTNASNPSVSRSPIKSGAAAADPKQ